MRSSRGELGLAVLLCLAGASLVLLAASRAWAEITFTGRALLPDEVVVVAGADLVPGVRALALVGLAGVVALLATRGAGRLLVGALLALDGAAVVAVVLRLRGRFAQAVADDVAVRESGSLLPAPSPDPSAWLWVCVVGGAVLVVAGLLVAVRGRRWAAMSRRYETPAARADAPVEPTERSLWEALDRGEDPTRG